MKRITIMLLLLPITSVAMAQSQGIFSIGYGNSYGGIGGNIGVDVQNEAMFHIGAGYFPLSLQYENAKDMILLAGGIRTYFIESFFGDQFGNSSRLFTDFQFGMIGGEFYEEFISSGSQTEHSKTQQALYGPSILIGLEANIKDNNYGVRIALGGSYNLQEALVFKSDFFFALDLGLFIRF